jgi:transcription factor SPN1
MEVGPTTYTVVPKSNVTFNPENAKRTGGGAEDILKKIKAKQTGRR